ncbi:hypothetical protein, partial [Catellatospora chokoriensis]|uniref:hypothetical protein n=1 Tax=Catellatospora chokoriensis TaxID=310353 RepID=UPI0031D24826
WGFEGLIRSLELTYGRHGWHPHTHELWFVDKRVDAGALGGEVLKRWKAVCRRAGLLKHGETGFDEHAVDVKGWCSASDYLAKQDDSQHWGADREVSKGGAKSGKGIHPFGLLRRSMDGCERSGGLFVRYARAMQGARQIFWTHGLKARVGLQDQDDQEIAEEQREKAQVLGRLWPADWRLIRGQGYRAQVLEAAEDGGWPAVQALLE